MPVIFFLLMPLLVLGKVQTEKLKNGTMYFDDKSSKRRPGIVILPDTRGPVSFIHSRAEDLAKLGYVSLVTPWSANQKKARAAFDELISHSRVNSKKMMLLGYGQGGTTALNLARAGVPAQAVVSFYGSLKSKQKAKAPLTAHVLLFHGDEDPFVPEKDIIAFQQEMQEAQAKWQIINYGNTYHSFADPDAGTNTRRGRAYNQFSDHRSWDQLVRYLKELF